MNTLAFSTQFLSRPSEVESTGSFPGGNFLIWTEIREIRLRAWRDRLCVGRASSSSDIPPRPKTPSPPMARASELTAARHGRETDHCWLLLDSNNSSRNSTSSLEQTS